MNKFKEIKRTDFKSKRNIDFIPKFKISYDCTAMSKVQLEKNEEREIE